MNKIISVIIAILALSSIAFAADVPIGLQKILEYNQQQANMYVQSLTLFVVFLAGIVSFLAPCTLAIIPIYFSVAFKEKRRVLPMTILFFLGFTISFITLGLAASALGHTFTAMQIKYSYLILIAGILLIILGLLSIFNKGFTLFKPNLKLGSGPFSVFLMGMLFALGWSACVGPVLSGVLLIASLVSYTKAAALMFVYALGNFIPFIIISSLIDRYNLLENKWISGREFKANIFGKELIFHTTTLISGLLLLGMGLLFVIYGDTSVINNLDPFRLKFFEEGLQRKLVDFRYSWAIALLVALLASLLAWLALKRKR